LLQVWAYGKRWKFWCFKVFCWWAHPLVLLFIVYHWNIYDIYIGYCFPLTSFEFQSISRIVHPHTTIKMLFLVLIIMLIWWLACLLWCILTIPMVIAMLLLEQILLFLRSKCMWPRYCSSLWYQLLNFKFSFNVNFFAFVWQE
jgi:hypothetical protein